MCWRVLKFVKKSFLKKVQKTFVSTNQCLAKKKIFHKSSTLFLQNLLESTLPPTRILTEGLYELVFWDNNLFQSNKILYIHHIGVFVGNNYIKD